MRRNKNGMKSKYIIPTPVCRQSMANETSRHTLSVRRICGSHYSRGEKSKICSQKTSVWFPALPLICHMRFNSTRSICFLHVRSVNHLTCLITLQMTEVYLHTYSFVPVLPPPDGCSLELGLGQILEPFLHPSFLM